MPLSHGLRPSLPRATLLVVLLLITLSLAVFLGYEANQAVRSQRLTAERAVRDYASFVARDVAAGVREQVHGRLVEALAPVNRSKLVTPYAPLPHVAMLAVSAAAAFPCGSEGQDPGRFYFAVDFRDGGVTTVGATVAAALSAWIRDTVTANARVNFRPESWYAAIIGQGEWRDHALIYGVKQAAHGAPVAAYGFVTCPAAFGAPLFAAPARRAAQASFPGDSLLALSVTDQAGRVLYEWPVSWDSPFTGEVRLEQLGTLHLRAKVHSAALDLLFAGRRPGPGTGAILAMLVLTAGLAAIALVQLRREHELARQRTDFSSSVSHELRTPLSQILLYGETLSLDRLRSEEERRQAAEVIVHEAQRLMHMVENVLHFARGERGEYKLAVRAIPLASQLRSILTSFAPLAEASRVRLRADLDEDVVALADPGALRQIVLNLLDNAVKYGPLGQVVTVTAARVDQRAEIRVEDEGPGIPAADRKRVWRPFVRLGSRDDSARGGSGIGLAVVCELVHRLDGAVRIDSAAGGGAAFIVELPLTPRGRESARVKWELPSSNGEADRVGPGSRGQRERAR